MTVRERAVLRGHKSSVWTLRFAPDGQTLASGSMDKTARLWNVATGKERATLEPKAGGVHSVAFDPSDGNTLATASGDWGKIGALKLWDVEAGQQRRTLIQDSDHLSMAAFTSDGRTLVTGGGDRDSQTKDGTFYMKIGPGGSWFTLWDMPAGQPRAQLNEEPWTFISSLAISPDDTILATGRFRPPFVKLFDLKTAALVGTLGGADEEPPDRRSSSSGRP